MRCEQNFTTGVPLSRPAHQKPFYREALGDRRWDPRQRPDEVRLRLDSDGRRIWIVDAHRDESDSLFAPL